MANNTDPLQSAITDGRVFTEPEFPYDTITVLDFDMDRFNTNLRAWLTPAIQGIYEVRATFGGTQADIDDTIELGVNAMTDFACLILYNRLRTVVERYSIATRTARMNPRAPVNNRMEFPQWFSSLLSSIGPLSIPDTATETLVVYATTAATAARFGRANAVNPLEPHWAHLAAGLRRAGVTFAPIDMNNLRGSAFTTAVPTFDNGQWSVFTTVHHSHYENEDIIRAITSTNPDDRTSPFPDISITIDRCTIQEVTTALAANRPATIPANDPRLATLRPNNFTSLVNGYGINPAIAAADGVEARAAYCYIVGRGSRAYFRMRLARRLNTTEVLACLRFRLTGRA